MPIKPDIHEIVAQENLVIRNLQITLGYYRLSQAMRKFMSTKNVSWVGFATHASRTAGQALRHELMPKRLKSAMIRAAGFDSTYIFFMDTLNKQKLNASEESKNRLAEALKRVSLLVSEGNVIVFAELAKPFSNFINTFSNDWQPNEEKFQAFLNENLKPGPIEQDGQDLLFGAFEAYYKARFETDNKRKAEYVLQGNLLIGLHEQTRLQPQIDQALAVPYDFFVDDSEKAAEKKKGKNKRFKIQPAGIRRQMVIKAVTRMWMSFSLPNRELKLGQNVVAPTGVISFPIDLITIDNNECKSLVNRFDKSRNTLTGSAADNWGSLADRMGFVVDFFRSHQQNKHLFEQPFMDSQIPTIEDGHMPAGPL